jgi:hypothetical protein
MNVYLVVRFRRAMRIARSRRPAVRLFRGWRYFTTDPSGRTAHSAADILLLPLAGLALTSWLLATVPGAVDVISLACSADCLP